MIKNFISKALGKKSADQIKTEAFTTQLKEGASNIFNIICEKLKFAQQEIKIIREKTKNLLDTNYKLGLYHLEKGNLQDAVIRFSIIIKFWPNFYEAYYQKAYVQMLQGKAFNAKKTMNILMSKNPNDLDPKFQSLIDEIDSSLQSYTNND